ncbi:actin-like ATPase domain-containing protein [Ascobolus immersus RN42]|uniref:Actin-like ATPase domain-containing protein n=1 Tax=Ascobolus immersus RN42 TaxID=1160509 RepID=A0A3N4I6X0_ASCIM|nr:actin-like ATPase domain-containing protein [Ascobolus immersus RN42]
MASKMDTGIFVGISLGNTNSMVALCGDDGKTHVIANEEGDRAIPSVLSFDKDEVFHGTEARKRLISSPESTFAGFVDSYFLGDGTTERIVGDRKVTVEELMRHHLLKLKECAENYTGVAAHGAVVSVPSGASKSKQEEFVVLVKECGFSVVQLVNEAACCLTAYEPSEGRGNDDGFDAVLDFSGSKFSISLFKSSKGLHGLVDSASNEAVSGSKLDLILRNYLVGLFKKEHKVDIPHGKALSRLQQEAEAARITLSSSTKATVSIDSLFNNCDLHTTVTKLRVDMLFRSFYRELGDFITTFLTDQGLDISDIRNVALCGGVANTPKITALVQSILSGSTILSPAESYDRSAFTMEACARGAALQGSLLANLPTDDLSNYLDTALHFSVPVKDIYLILSDETLPVFLYGATSAPETDVTRDITIENPAFDFRIVEGHWVSIAALDEGDDEDSEEGDDGNVGPKRVFKEDTILLKGRGQTTSKSLHIKVFCHPELSVEFHAEGQVLLSRTVL